MAAKFGGRSGKLDITIEKGQTFRLSAVYKVKSTGAPIDNSGWNVVMQIRARKSDTGVPLLELLSTNLTPDPRIELGGANGSLDLVIEDETTALITWKTAFYDVVYETATNEKFRLLEGKVTVSDGVTE